jgi:NADH-quinone oxidoreductase subunit L
MAATAGTPHESPAIMTMPLVILAACTMLMGLIGTPAWPWFDSFVDGKRARLDFGGFGEKDLVPVMLLSTSIFFIGLGLGWWLYGRKPVGAASDPDALERMQPQIFNLLRRAFFVDEFYEATFIRFNGWCARLSDWFDRWIWGGVVQLVSYVVLGLSWVNRSLDAWVVNPGFDQGCRSVTGGGQLLSRLQSGRAQTYLRIVGIAFVALVLFLIWGGHG